MQLALTCKEHPVVTISQCATSSSLDNPTELKSCTLTLNPILPTLHTNPPDSPFLAHLEPELNLYSIILGDPVMSPRCPERELVGKMFADMCLARRDVWSSRDAAREYFERNPFTKGWPLDAKELYLVRFSPILSQKYFLN